MWRPAGGVISCQPGRWSLRSPVVRADSPGAGQISPAMMAAFKPYRIIEFPDARAIKRKSQFIGRTDRGLATSKLSHNLNGTTVRFAGCDKKRARLSPRCNCVSDAALSKFIRIFRHNDTHWSKALIDCRNSTLRLLAASSQIGTNCTSHRNGVALPLPRAGRRGFSDACP